MSSQASGTVTQDISDQSTVIPTDDLAKQSQGNDSQDDAPDTNHVTTTWLREHAKEFMAEWTRAGLTKYVDLPMICVMGDTSSGKSSVLSSLIGLELPSSSKLTTKCPVLIQLHHAGSDEQPRARIDIQWHENKADSSSHGPSPRQRKRDIERQISEDWQRTTEVKNDEKKDSFSPSTSKSAQSPPPPPPPPPRWQVRTIFQNLEQEVPKCIDMAQETILGYRETHVAPDVICLTLWSPACQEELTLVDLPGIVQYQHQQDISLLSQVENVVLEYIQNRRSILVPVVAAPTNVHNSKVLQWTKEVDPTTIRTVPVLTKPDLMDPGSESDVLDLLESPLISGFHHGFFLVMNRGQAQLDSGMSLSTALQLESEYFASTIPWNAMSEQRLGIPALRGRLAMTLSRVMQETIPDVLKELQAKKEETQAELEAMGVIFQSRTDQRKFFHSLAHDLVATISASLSGKGKLRRNTFSNGKGALGSMRSEQESSSVSGASRLHAACHEFLEEIQSSSLGTVNKLVEGAAVIVSSPGSQRDVRGEIVHMAPTGLYACVDFVDIEDHTTDVLFDGIDFKQDIPDFTVDEVWSDDGNRVFIGRSGGHFDSLRKIPCNRIRSDASWLQAKMDHYRTDDLACFINVDMFQHVVAEFVHQDWVPPCHRLVDALQDILKESIDHALQDQALTTQRFPLLEKMIKSTCYRVKEECIARARGQVREHLEMEEQHPYTQDEVLLQAMNRSRFSALRTDLDVQLRLDQEGVVYDTQAIQTILDSVFSKHQSSNWMVEQMELVLSCYGQVATQRVLDRTPQICWQACRSLAKALQQELGCVTDDVMETCLWESPATKKKFQELTVRLDELKTTLDAVQAMG